MRTQILEVLFQRMRTNPDVFFLNADMGINLVERFGESYPNRYANVGIAEQNLISISAGLCNLGFRPFAYTISNFLIHRCYEQIRNDIALHDYPVTLLGTSTGFDNAPLGPTHHIVDDWGPLKSIPGIDIYCPSSVTYAEQLIDQILKEGRPAYVRIPKGEYAEPTSPLNYVIIEGESKGVVVVSYGSLVQTCLEARRQDPSISVLVVNRLHPLESKELADILAPYKRVVIVEDHFPITGLYGSVCEIFVQHGLRGRLESAAPTRYCFDVGTSSDYFLNKFGLDATGLLRRLRE